MLLRSANPYIVSYRTAKQRIEEDESRTFGFRMLDPQLHDPRRYNRPTASEVAVIMEGDGTELRQGRDIVIQTHGNRLQRVSELHSSFLPLRFPLLRLYGKPGWHPNIPFSTSNSAGNAFRINGDSPDPPPTQRGKGGLTRVSQAQWYSYYLHERPDQFSVLHHAGELLQEFIVDAWAQTEANRLRFIKQNQLQLCTDLYNGLADSADGTISLDELGKRSVLPSSFTGSPRQMVQLYQDALAIVRHGGM